MNQTAIRSTAAIVCLTVCLLSGIQSQQAPSANADPGSKGIALYVEGDMEGAVKVLREAVKKRKDDSKAWHYLGLAFNGQGNVTEANKALSKAVDLRYTAFNKELHSQQYEDVSENQLLRLKDLVKDLIESQKKQLEILATRQAVEKEQLALERSQVQAACMEQHTRIVGGHSTLKMSDMKMQKARVLNKPEPMFPFGAGRGGTVVFKAIVATDGSVRHIELIRSPGDAFTEEAKRALLQARFQPASICGKVVATPLQLEYMFMLG